MRLICFLNHGSPSIEASHRVVDCYVEGGADVVETDFPADDPYLDGENIKIRMHEALTKCHDYDKYMESVETILKEHPGIHLYMLIYEETIMAIGMDKFLAFLRRNNLQEVLLVGARHPEVRARLLAEKLKVSAYIEYHLPEDEIETAKQTTGFVYLQATPSGKFHPQYKDLKSIIKYLREERGITNEINCGIGIHDYDQVRMVRDAGADGVFIGTQVMNLHGQPDKLIAKVKELKAIASGQVK
ncbi:MAG: tryptophan synthase subunit alpha [Bacilli bacterium]|jgi:tryptophan synthase alpha chain|nr:tryptophan synthase subunit alpha [Bacilli bacterium]MCH4235586.1 tryptophan synthase subunit alpha [Bacilli bacterium]